MGFIIFAVPVFFLLIGVELLIQRLRRTELYRFSDAVSNISCGIVQQVTGAALGAVLIVGYLYLYEHYRLFDIPDTLWTYVLLFVGVDFFYYWFHRYAHEINLFWGSHVVHHQSEEYNLSVALRQSATQGFVSTWFYLPLALLGFNPVAFIAVRSIQTLYQFWIHTRTIDRLHPWVEFVFNTPSHHRVHHGRNPEYIDKNHGGTLIIFDRMFGTFQAERAPVVYGVTKPLHTWDPIRANLDYYYDLWRDLRRPISWRDRMTLLFQKPGWLPDAEGGPRSVPPIDEQETDKYDTPTPPALVNYVLVQFVLMLLLSVGVLLRFGALSSVGQLLSIFTICASAFGLGTLLDGRRKAVWVECTRLLLLPPLIWQATGSMMNTGGAVIGVALSWLVLWAIHNGLQPRRKIV